MYPATVTVTDSDGDTDSETITITVTEANVAPVLDAIGKKGANELVELTFTATATDADLPAQTLTFSLGDGAPAGAAITAGGVFTWTPTEAQGPGTYDIRVEVSDGAGGTDFEVIMVTVGSPPVLDPIGNKTVDEGIQLSFTATATDADLPAQPLTFSLGAGAPTGAAITAGGVFTWTPTEAQGPDTHDITVVVSDGVSTDTETITVTVNEVNVAPVLGAIGNRTVNELALFTFTATATDADLPAQSRTFSLGAGAPAGAAITSGGVFTWTPTEAQGPGSYPITVAVTDSYGGTDSETITVTVNEVVSLAPVYRFYNFTNNTHFFTPSAEEADIVIANYPKVFRYEGICYYTNPANNTQPLYRFYNRNSSSHFYTASAEEAAHILATWPHIFTLDGQTYAVNPAPVPELHAGLPLLQPHQRQPLLHGLRRRGGHGDRDLAAPSTASRARPSGSGSRRSAAGRVATDGLTSTGRSSRSALSGVPARAMG